MKHINKKSAFIGVYKFYLIFLLLIAAFSLHVVFTKFSKNVLAESATQTFTKNGLRYVVTKTIENGQTTIVTNIYDESGNLVDSKTVTKDAKQQPVKERTTPTQKPGDETSRPTPTTTPLVRPTAPVNPTIEPVVPERNPVQPSITPNTERGNTNNVITGNAEARITEIREDMKDARLLRVQAQEQKRLLGLFRVSVNKELEFNSQTGEVREKMLSIRDYIMEFLSF